MSTVESIARPRRNGERRRAPTASISKESPAITGVVEMVIRRSEERFSRNAETDLVCRLLLEKKKNFVRTSSKGSGPITDITVRRYRKQMRKILIKGKSSFVTLVGDHRL